MPVNNTRNTLLRQWELLRLLPSTGSGKTVRQLTDDLNNLNFSVSVRQVERDLKQLQGAMPIECNDSGKPHGWRWIKGSSRHIAAMSLPEALSWQLVADTVKPLLPLSILEALEPHFHEAHEKLTALADSNPAALWTQKIRVVQPALPLIAPAINSAVLEQVQQALLCHHQLEVSYRSISSDQVKEMVLHPLGLVQRGAASYLVATAFSFTEPRLFALHRVEKATVLESLARTPDSFRLDDYITSGALHFGSGTMIQLEILVDAWLKKILQETPLSTDQQLEMDDQESRFRVTATVADTWQLHWWILSKSDALEVLQPVLLRENIKKQLKSAAKQY
jgi:predicted DNA-binding transcriptional regulator YafY